MALAGEGQEGAWGPLALYTPPLPTAEVLQRGVAEPPRSWERGARRQQRVRGWGCPEREGWGTEVERSVGREVTDEGLCE